MFNKITELIRDTNTKNDKYPSPLLLDQKHIQNCRVIPNRNLMLQVLPKNAVCGEIGVLFGDFSSAILQGTEPKEMHLFDIDSSFIDHARQKLTATSSSANLQFHIGDSSQVLKQFSEDYFDWLYIDGDHSYQGAWADLIEAHRVVKKTGYIIANDYIFYDHINKEKYGVIEAVNQFCIEFDYEILYFVLQCQMFCDVVLRKRHS